MKIFIFSHFKPRPGNHELISQISRIHSECRQAVPIIVVEERYNLADLKASILPTDHTHFELEDFRHVNITSGTEPNKIAQQMNRVDSNWVLIDFGQHDETTCTDFILELSRYNFTNPNLRNRSIIFITPAISPSLFARAANEHFNNLPRSSTLPANTDQIGKLFTTTHIEKILLRAPLLIDVLRLIHNSLLNVYRRIARQS